MFCMMLTIGGVLAWCLYEWMRCTRPPTDQQSIAYRKERRRSSGR